MATKIPEFDFSQYDPKDVWNFPPQRLVRFATEAYHVATDARKRWMGRYQHPDLRFVVWHELAGHSHALVVAAMHLRSHGNDLGWWEAQPEFDHSFDRRLVANNNNALIQLLHVGFVQNVLRNLDLAMRQVTQAISKGQIILNRPLRIVWKEVLAASEAEHFQQLLPLLQIYRDSLMLHGRFCPEDGQDLTIRYRSRTFAFASQMEIDPVGFGFVDQWDYLLFLIRESAAMLGQVFGSEILQGIGFIGLPYLK